MEKCGITRQATDGDTAKFKATHTHSEYVIPVALPLHQQLREHASVLIYTHSVCLVSAAMLETLQDLG